MMAARITFIGAGSLGFTSKSCERHFDVSIAGRFHNRLMDISKDRLEFARRAVQMLIDHGNYPARSRRPWIARPPLKGADAVLCTILAGGVDVWRHDIEIPKNTVSISMGGYARRRPVLSRICAPFRHVRYLPRY